MEPIMEAAIYLPCGCGQVHTYSVIFLGGYYPALFVTVHKRVFDKISQSTQPKVNRRSPSKSAKGKKTQTEQNESKKKLRSSNENNKWDNKAGTKKEADLQAVLAEESAC